MGTSKLCVGDSATGPTAGTNTCLPYDIFDGGFHSLSGLKGRYAYVYRVGDSTVGDKIYNLSKLRFYQTPNLVNSGTLFITNGYKPITDFEVDNLKNNLKTRSPRASTNAQINAIGGLLSTSTCYRISTTTNAALLATDGFIMGLDHVTE